MYDINDFKELYARLDSWSKVKYGPSGINAIKQKHHNDKTKEDIQYFQDVRNLLSHTPNGGDKPFIQLTDEFKKRFEVLCEKLMGSASSISVPYKDIYKRGINDKVLPTIAYMKEKLYSYVPILQGTKVYGVFSETTLFDILGDGMMELVDEDMKFADIENYITVYSKTGVYDFVGANTSIDDVTRKFSDAKKRNRRLDVLYITTTGDKKGDLVGLITVWDIANL